MQTDLASRIEKIWSMSDIALKQGAVDYGIDGHSKIARFAGMSFKFADDVLVRVRGPRLDIRISHLERNENVVFFPGAETILHFAAGDDRQLDRCYLELAGLQKTFSPKRAA